MSDNKAEEGRLRDDDGRRLVPADEISQIVSEAVNRVTSKSNETIEQLRSQVNKLESSNKSEDKKRHSRAQLNAWVEQGNLSQQEADDIWYTQQDERISERIDQATSSAIEKTTKTQQLQNEINKYIAHDPDLARNDTDSYRRVNKEILYQMNNLGLTESNLGIELNALNTVYGPPDKLSGPEIMQKERQTHQDISGKAGSPGPVSINKDGSPKGLTHDEKRYYADLIQKGIYRDWNEVAGEMKYADQALRQRVAARN